MAESFFDQANFTQGELDPRTTARVDWEQYYKALKIMRNYIAIPQGGYQSRWGTDIVASFINYIDPKYVQFDTAIFDDGSIYLMLWSNNAVKIYLANNLLATIVTTYVKEDIASLRFQTIQDSIFITSTRSTYPVAVLQRAPSAANVITGVAGNTITVTTAGTTGNIFPAQFTTSGTLPVTSPQIYPNITYFVKFTGTNAIQVYTSLDDAIAGTNFYTVTGAGTPTSNLIVFNSWSLGNVSFTVLPTYDFTNGSYQTPTFTFTPSATSGTVTITASAAIFTAAMVGGLFTGGTGVVRLTTFTDSTHMNGFTVSSFANTNAIVGQDCILEEPVWSASRGYPKFCSTYQNRLVLGGTISLPSATWESVTGNFINFDDSETLADNAISWYPIQPNPIKALTSNRSLIVHSDTATLSTPIVSEAPITPTNFVLNKMNSYGTSDLQPVFIDNKLFFVDSSGNNVISMIWEITQSTFVTTNASVGASSLVRHPVDMAAFYQSDYTDGFYVFFTNSDGTLCVHQTLHEDGVASWSLSNTQQTLYGGPNGLVNIIPNQYYHVVSAKKYCWFSVVRQILTAQAPVAITGVDTINNYITAIGHGMPLGSYYYVRFTNTGTLPTTNPQININTFYFAVPIDADHFRLYENYTDAAAANNNYIAITAYNGAGSTVIVNLTVPTLFIEQLDFTQYMDTVAVVNNGMPTSTITGLTVYEGEVVQVIGDGFWLNNQVVLNGTITIEHPSTNVTIGRQFIPTSSPLPLCIPGQMGTRYTPKKIRSVYINYYNSVYLQINGIDIPTSKEQVNYTSVAIPTSGVFNYTPMGGFDSEYSITITQPAPFPVTILGLSYIVEI